jgi:hypothetical protein
MTSKVVCPHCQYADSPAGARTCESCGHLLNAPEQVKRRRSGVFVLGIFLVAIAGFYLIARIIASSSDTARRSYMGNREYLDFGPQRFAIARDKFKVFSWRNQVETPICRVFGEIIGAPGTTLMVIDSVNHERLQQGRPVQPIQSWQITGQQSFRAQTDKGGQNFYVAVKYDGIGNDTILVQILELSVICYERWM